MTSRKHSYWLTGILALAMLASFVRADEEPPKTGQKAIAFTAKTMDGKTVEFPKDYKGKLVILDFWATWCGPCMGEVPGLAKAYQKYHEKGVDVLGVTLDKANNEEHIKAVMAENKMTWPQVYDGQFWQAAVAQLYHIESIPHAFLIDGDTGKVIAEGSSLRGRNLDATLEKALKERVK